MNFVILPLRNALPLAVTAGWQPLFNISHPGHWWRWTADKFGEQQLLRRSWGDGKFGLTHHKSPFISGPQTPFLESNMADFSGCKNNPWFFSCFWSCPCTSAEGWKIPWKTSLIIPGAGRKAMMDQAVVPEYQIKQYQGFWSTWGGKWGKVKISDR